jgi:hypothetical protein
MLDVNYSNGFDMNRVIPAFIQDDSGRLAWLQPSVSGAPTISTQNKTSVSGRYFDNFHALCNVVNVRDTFQDPLADDTAFDDYLQTLYKAVILRCLNGVFSKPELFDDSVKAYTRCSPSVNRAIENEGKFVGYKIDVAEKNDVSLQIHNVTLLFNDDVTIDFHLFADGDPEPIYTATVEAIANKPTIVDFDGLIFGYKTLLSFGKTYWFGYFQNDIGSVKAITELPEENSACMFCAEPAILNSNASDLDFTQYSVTNTPYGFNMELSSFRDYTNVIVKSARVFDEVIGLQMAAQVAENIMHATRSNGTERILKDQVTQLMVYMDLKGTVPVSDAPSTTGLSKQIERELVKLQKQFFPKPKAQIVSC